MFVQINHSCLLVTRELVATTSKYLILHISVSFVKVTVWLGLGRVAMLTGNCVRIEPNGHGVRVEWWRRWKATAMAPIPLPNIMPYAPSVVFAMYLVSSCHKSQLRAACFVIPLLFSLSLYLTFQWQDMPISMDTIFLIRPDRGRHEISSKLNALRMR
jgi:hypothetical protein